MTNNYLRYLKSTCYLCGANFSNFPAFFNSIDQEGHIHADSIALQKLMTEDLSFLQKNAMSIIKARHLYEFSDKKYLDNYKTILDTYANIFHLSSFPQLFIVDEIPCQGNSMWEAMSVDLEDEKRLGIKSGIYFQRRFLTHCYFEFVIAHEIMHWIISIFSKKYYPYVSLLEEGICDVYSAIVLNQSKLFDNDTIQNIILYNRHLKQNNTIWKNYGLAAYDVMRFILTFGIDNMNRIIIKGRPFDLDFSLHSSSYNINPATPVINNLLRVSSYTTIPAEQFILLKESSKNHLNEYVSRSTLVQESVLEEDVATKAVDELVNQGFLLSYMDKLYQPNSINNLRLKYAN